MASGVNTKFDPERIAQVAEALSAYQTKLSGCLDTMTQRTEFLKKCWQSDAADAYQTKAAQFKTAGGELAETLLSLADRLRQISGIQRQSEKDTSMEAEALPIEGVN